MITYPIIFWQGASGSGPVAPPETGAVTLIESGALCLELSGNLRYVAVVPTGGAGGTLEYWLDPEERSHGNMPTTKVYWYYNP